MGLTRLKIQISSLLKRQVPFFETLSVGSVPGTVHAFFFLINNRFRPKKAFICLRVEFRRKKTVPLNETMPLPGDRLRRVRREEGGLLLRRRLQGQRAAQPHYNAHSLHEGAQ